MTRWFKLALRIEYAYGVVHHVYEGGFQGPEYAHLAAERWVKENYPSTTRMQVFTVSDSPMPTSPRGVVSPAPQEKK